MKKNVDLVILCGGQGKRLGNITKKTPKPLIKICKKPFIEHLINFYQRYDFNHIYFIGYYKSQKFKKIFNNKYYNFIKCEFIKEKKALDTGGALNSIEAKIKNDFVLINGDSFLNYNFDKFDKFHNTDNSHSMILIENKNYKSNTKLNCLKLENRKVTFGSKSKYMNSGIYYFKKKIFKEIKKNTKVSLEKDILPHLIKNKKIKGMTDNNFFIDIGILKNLEFAKKNFKKIIYKPAIFLDRDGVLNFDAGYDYIFSKMKWIKKTLSFLSRLKNNKIRFFIVTNQSGIGRGIYTERAFLELHKKIKKFLIKKNIFIDEVKFCPHHPIFGIGNYKKKCGCRKPNNKMIIDIFNSWSVDIKKSIMIGDKKTDLIAAKKSNIKFFYQNKKSFNEINRIFKKNLI